MCMKWSKFLCLRVTPNFKVLSLLVQSTKGIENWKKSGKNRRTLNN